MFDDGVFVYFVAPLNQTQAVVKIAVCFFSICKNVLCMPVFGVFSLHNLNFDLQGTGPRPHTLRRTSSLRMGRAPADLGKSARSYIFFMIFLVSYMVLGLVSMVTPLHLSMSFFSFSFWGPGGGWGGGRTDLVRHALAQAAQETSSEMPYSILLDFFFLFLDPLDFLVCTS